MPSRRKSKKSDTPPAASAQPTQPAVPSSVPSGASIQLVVSNTTPLITLGEIGLLDALRQLYGAIWIPPTVLAEYQLGRSAYPQRPDLQGIPWVTVQLAPIDPLVPTSLDAGERDAIALARSLQATRILLDERNARAVATRLNLIVTGSAGVLLAAKQVGIIPLVKPYLDRIMAQGRYLSPSLYEQIARQAGE
jgi:predicted nucleic acid-binding protein